SFLRDSEFVPKLRDARNGIVQSGGLRDEVQTCIARQHRALVWKVLGGIGGGLLAAGVTTALVLRFPPATSPLAGAAMSSPALHLTLYAPAPGTAVIDALVLPLCAHAGARRAGRNSTVPGRA
ncbi:MAG TPA: hypothetical protein PLP98_04695, partial [Plasticicumulans sp.]|nr:hypothetical protein [Plasticicumulans sp.]